MTLFIAATTLSPDAVNSPDQYAQLEKDVAEKIKRECRHVEWKANYALMGPYDYLDVFEAPDVEEAMKAAAILRSRGHARVEVWPAKDWQRFKELMHEIEAA
ncbi:MAG: GYD domain-containing protein [bacterium]